ncbi:hypothetical protein ACFL2R_03725 [Patescibacteria group bacterium]
MGKSNLVYFNPNQDLEKETLLRVHEVFTRITSVGDFNESIEKLKSAIEGNAGIMKRVAINRDGLLGSLRRVSLAFEECQKIEGGHEGHDRREVFVCTFFHNAKCFFEIARKMPGIKIGDFLFKRVSRDVTTIRNFFAHSYEKDFLEERSSVFVRLNINHGVSEESEQLLELEVFDLEESRKIYSMYFSLESFFMQINKIVENITNEIG